MSANAPVSRSILGLLNFPLPLVPNFPMTETIQIVGMTVTKVNQETAEFPVGQAAAQLNQSKGPRSRSHLYSGFGTCYSQVFR